jgi:hypothetical protein
MTERLEGKTATHIAVELTIEHLVRCLKYRYRLA